MMTARGHTLQLGERHQRIAGVLATRVTLECPCGAIFASELLIAPNGRERALIRAAGWDASQAHLTEIADLGLPNADCGVGDPKSSIGNPKSAIP